MAHINQRPQIVYSPCPICGEVHIAHKRLGVLLCSCTRATLLLAPRVDDCQWVYPLPQLPRVHQRNLRNEYR